MSEQKLQVKKVCDLPVWQVEDFSCETLDSHNLLVFGAGGNAKARISIKTLFDLMMLCKGEDITDMLTDNGGSSDACCEAMAEALTTISGGINSLVSSNNSVVANLQELNERTRTGDEFIHITTAGVYKTNEIIGLSEGNGKQIHQLVVVSYEGQHIFESPIGQTPTPIKKHGQRLIEGDEKLGIRYPIEHDFKITVGTGNVLLAVEYIL